MTVMATRLITVPFHPILTGSISGRCSVLFLRISIGSLATEIRYVEGMTGR
jgi:hypothetical protein